MAKEKQKKRTRARPRRGNIDRPDKPWHSHLYYLMQTPEDNVFPGEGKYNTYIVAKYNAFICSVNDMIDKAFKKGVDAIVRDKGIVSRQDREYIFNAVEKERIELYEEYAEHYVGAVIALVDRVESGDAIPKKEWDENYGWAYVNEWKKATEERLQTHVFCIVPGEEYVYTAQVSTVEPELDMKPPHLEKKRTELAEKITEIGFSLYDKQ